MDALQLPATASPGRPPGQDVAEPLAAVQHVVGAVALARAAELARAGRLDHAAQLVDRLVSSAGMATSPSALALLARIHAQRGDLTAARACWRRALASQPDLPGGTAALRRLDLIEAHPRWSAVRWAAPLLALGLLIVADLALLVRLLAGVVQPR